MAGSPRLREVPAKWSKQKSVCGISVVKREIAVVKTTAISILVDPIGIEPTTLQDANRTLSQLSYGPISKSIMLMQTTQQIYEIYCKNERHGLMGDGC